PPLEHRTDEDVPFPGRKTIARIEHEARHRNRRYPVDERRLEIRARRGVAHLLAVVPRPVGDERPAVVPSGQDDVELVTAERTVLVLPDRPGVRMNGQPLRAAMADRIDL